MGASVQISPPEGAPDLGDDLVGPAEDVGRGEAQDDPAGRYELVLASQVVHEHISLAVHVAVELDQHHAVGPH